MMIFNQTLAGLVLALAMSSAVGSIAAATPGDVQCFGTTKDGKAILVLKGYESVDHDTPLTLEISVGGKKVASFPDGSVRSRYINVGTIKQSFMNFQEYAESKGNKVSLRYPEQAGDVDSVVTYITLEVPAEKLNLDDIQLACPN